MPFLEAEHVYVANIDEIDLADRPEIRIVSCTPESGGWIRAAGFQPYDFAVLVISLMRTAFELRTISLPTTMAARQYYKQATTSCMIQNPLSRPISKSSFNAQDGTSLPNLASTP